MYVPFESLPPHARIWIYQSNRKLSETEVLEITEQTEAFLHEWSAHGQPLEASFVIKYNRFLIIAVNQDVQAATGCSIDASVKFIQNLEQKYAIDLLDKMNVTYKQGEFIAHKSLIDFKKMAKEKAVNANTIVFNNLVNTIEEWQDFWEVPASESWHNRFF
ncbi:ABC transporter ATPase [Flavobacterium sp.]|uniref:ABC transporter ATPase n=1 Tax=Flavobacterium sp. TaxID=239 RepID=UPI0035297D2E